MPVQRNLAALVGLAAALGGSVDVSRGVPVYGGDDRQACAIADIVLWSSVDDMDWFGGDARQESPP